MRKLVTLALSAALALGFIPPTAAQDLTPNPGAWRPLVRSDLKTERPDNLTYIDIWQDAIVANNSVLAAIWRDRLAAEREKLAALTKTSPGSSSGASTIVVPVFEASFKDGDKTLIVSALFTTPECKNFSGATAPSLNNCPMRVAVLRNGKTRVVASEADFPFVAALRETPENKPSEYDNESQRDKTMVVFNPATDEITKAITLNGSLDTEKAPAIRGAF